MPLLLQLKDLFSQMNDIVYVVDIRNHLVLKNVFAFWHVLGLRRFIMQKWNENTHHQHVVEFFVEGLPHDFLSAFVSV